MASRKENSLLALALLGIFLVTAFVATAVFNSYPYSMDEYSMLYQAQLFSQGLFSREAQPYNSVIVDNWIVNSNGRLFSKYAPAPAALYTIGLLFGQPQLINPILSTLTALLVFLIVKDAFNIKIAWLVLGMLGTSPYFYPYAASFFAQPLALFVATMCMYLLWKHLKNPSLLTCGLIGLSIGILFLGRQLDAACLGISIAITMLWPRGRLKNFVPLLVVTLTTLPGIAAMVYYIYYQTGHAGISAISAWSHDLKVIAPTGAGIWNNIRMTGLNFIEWWFKYTLPSLYTIFLPHIGIGAFFIFMLGCLRPISTYWVFLLSFIVITVCAYTLHPSTGWPQYGTRYWYCCLSAFLVISASGIQWIKSTIPPRMFATLYALLLVTQLGSLSLKLSDYERRFDLQEAIWSDIHSTCPEKTIVVLESSAPLDVNGIAFFQWSDFKRNPPPLRDRLYILANENLAKLQTSFPDYSVCKYNFRGGKLKDALPGFPKLDKLSIFH